MSRKTGNFSLLAKVMKDSPSLSCLWGCLTTCFTHMQQYDLRSQKNDWFISLWVHKYIEGQLFNNATCFLGCCLQSRPLIQSQPRRQSKKRKQIPDVMGFHDWNSPWSHCNVFNTWVSEDAIPFCLSGHWPCDLFKLCFLCSALKVLVLKELYLVPTDLFLTPVASV